MKKITYLIPIISAGIFFYLGLNANSIDESIKKPIEYKEIANVDNQQNKKQVVEEKLPNYTIEHCKHHIKRLKENVQNLYLEQLFELKKTKYKNERRTNCLVIYYLEIRKKDSDTQWLVELEKNYSHLNALDRYKKLEEFREPEYQRQKKERLEAQKIKIPEYVKEYDYVDYESKTIPVFGEEIYEDEEVRIRNIDKNHNHGHFNPEYATYPYSKKTTFDVKKFSDTILHFIGDKINNYNPNAITNDKIIFLNKSKFPIQFLEFEYQNKNYKIKLDDIYYKGFKRDGVLLIGNSHTVSSFGTLKLYTKTNELKGFIRLKNNEKIRLNFKNNEGYIYTYKTNDPVDYTID